MCSSVCSPEFVCQLSVNNFCQGRIDGQDSFTCSQSVGNKPSSVSQTGFSGHSSRKDDSLCVTCVEDPIVNCFCACAMVQSNFSICRKPPFRTLLHTFAQETIPLITFDNMPAGSQSAGSSVAAKEEVSVSPSGPHFAPDLGSSINVGQDAPPTQVAMWLMTVSQLYDSCLGQVKAGNKDNDFWSQVDSVLEGFGLEGLGDCRDSFTNAAIRAGQGEEFEHILSSDWRT